MKTVPILNCEFGAVTLEETVEWARDWIQSGRRGYLCTVNVAILMMMRSSPGLQRFVDGASLVVADGQPLVWASSRQLVRLPLGRLNPGRACRACAPDRRASLMGPQHRPSGKQ